MVIVMEKVLALWLSNTHLIYTTNTLRQLLNEGQKVLSFRCGEIVLEIEPIWDVKSATWPPLR